MIEFSLGSAGQLLPSQDSFASCGFTFNVDLLNMLHGLPSTTCGIALWSIVTPGRQVSSVLKISEYVTLTAKRKCHPPEYLFNKGSIRRQAKSGSSLGITHSEIVR
jgi:hypothetical protein